MEFQSVSFTAYLGASVISLLLTLTYAFQFVNRQPTKILVGATLVHSLNLLLITLSYWKFSGNYLVVYAWEFLHFFVWIVTIGLLIRADIGSSQMPANMARLSWTAGILALTGSGALATQILEPEFLLIFFALILAIISLLSVEQLYRTAAIHSRQIKLVCISLLCIFLFDIYLFSHSLIFAKIDNLLWQLRAAVSIVACLAMTLGGLLFTQQRDNPSGLVLSRPIAFYSTSLLAAGSIVIVLWLAGYYVKDYGGNWGALVYGFIFITAVVLIASLLVSAAFRNRMSVLINKHLFSYKYDYRHEWLRLINYLAEPAQLHEINQRAFFAVSSVTRAPSGAMWLLKQGFYEPVYRANLPSFVELQEEPTNSPFCRAFIESDWVFIPDSRRENAQSQHNEVLPAWTHNIPDLWLIFPLSVADELTGFIALTKPPGAETLTWEDLDLLKTIGRQIASYLKRHHQAEQLAEIKQFDTYNKLVAFIVHDLNNLVAQQALLVRNAEKHKHNPEFVDDVINTIHHSVDRMNRLLKKLRREETESVTLVPVQEVIEQALQECQQGASNVTYDIENSDRTLIGDPVRLVMTISHFIKNAQDATADKGEVHVTLRIHNDIVTITIEDTGSGMDWDFIHNRLFKPFETTKSGKGMGIGAYLSKEYINELGGALNVISAPGMGTTVTISLPLLQE